MALSIPDMIQKIQQRATIPEIDPLFTTDRILQALNDELKETVYADFINLHNGTAVQIVDIPLQINGIDQYPTGLIPFPRRCYGTMIRNAIYVNSGKIVCSVPLLSDVQIDNFQFIENDFSRSLAGIFVENDFIKLVPTQKDNDGALRIRYVVKVPTLVNNPQLFGKISNIIRSVPNGTPLLAQVETDNSFAYIDEYCPNGSVNYFDIYRKSTGSIIMVDVLMQREEVIVGSSNIFTIQSPFTNDQVQELINCQLGGYPRVSYVDSDLLLMPADQNFFIPINSEIDDYLAVKTGSRLLRSQGNIEEADDLEKNAANIWQKIMPLFAKRIKANVEVFKPNRGVRNYGTGFGRFGRWVR